MQSINKRAEGRNTPVFAFAIIGLLLVGVLVFLLISVSTNTRDAVLGQTDDYYLTSGVVVRGLFSIASVQFADTQNASCSLADTYYRPVIMTMRFNAFELPTSCSVFVNEVLTTNYNKLAPDCRFSCDFQQFNRQFSIGNIDYRDDHLIKVCCDQICLQKELVGLCGTIPE